jgi:hypothetical protein
MDEISCLVYSVERADDENEMKNIVAGADFVR